jgi:hypothetical protein
MAILRGCESSPPNTWEDWGPIRASIMNRPKDSVRPTLTTSGQGSPDTSPKTPKIHFQDATVLETLTFFRTNWPVNYMFDPAVNSAQKRIQNHGCASNLPGNCRCSDSGTLRP